MKKSKNKITDFQKAYIALTKGKTLVISTDTVYGLVSKSPKNIYSIKQRSLKKN